MKSFLSKLAILLLLLLLLQLLAGFLYPMEIPPEILQFQQHLENEVDILYFGDSTVWYPRGSQTIPQMLQEYFADRTVGEISHAAYNLDIYLHYVQKLVRYRADHDSRPDLVIIPINLHSFAAEWDQRPEYQFTEEKRVLDYGITWSRWFGRPYNVFGGYDSPITNEEFLTTNVYSNTVVVGKVADFEDTLGNARLEEKENARFVYYQTLPEEGLMANTLIYYYMMPLSPEHRKLRSMVQIIALLQEQGIDLLFYITPIDAELGDVYLGESFRQRFTSNKEVVLALLKAHNTPVLDLSYDLAPFYFSDTEHLQQDGKRYIAEQLVAQIDPSLPLDRNFALDGSVDEQITVGSTPTAVTTPTPLATIDAVANPLLATAAARATEASGGALAVTSTPIAP